MNISYDIKIDALYIKLIPGVHELDTRHVDADIALDFDELDRLIGLEVLDASKPLELRYLLPVEVIKDSGGSELSSMTARAKRSNGRWAKLRHELLRTKAENEPVLTLKQHRINWVTAVERDYIALARDQSGSVVKVSRLEFEQATKGQLLTDYKWAITNALRDIALKL